ncbi:hypothetical protein HU200_060523 [Digitaria exilis]|uniref:RING-type E3 ubiquitin transferase n=1 Tax=Digitaria exilis TaxID=1010633 RepID=A0A835AC16_9POAL|nr:hypothetical protein HU200_060523 [Digitaria exilis]
MALDQLLRRHSVSVTGWLILGFSLVSVKIIVPPFVPVGPGVGPITFQLVLILSLARRRTKSWKLTSDQDGRRRRRRRRRQRIPDGRRPTAVGGVAVDRAASVQRHAARFFPCPEPLHPLPSPVASRRLPVHHQLRHGAHLDHVLVGFMRDGVWYNRDGEPVVDDGGFGAVPASEEAIAALPETTVGECDGETREKEAECVVCLEDYQAGDKLRTLPCSHGFHERCILPWLRVSRLCPLCRFALPAAAAAETESLVDEEENEEDDDDAIR